MKMYIGSNCKNADKIYLIELSCEKQAFVDCYALSYVISRRLCKFHLFSTYEGCIISRNIFMMSLSKQRRFRQMNQIEIGGFIAKKRKEKNLTQAGLAVGVMLVGVYVAVRGFVKQHE